MQLQTIQSLKQKNEGKKRMKMFKFSNKIFEIRLMFKIINFEIKTFESLKRVDIQWHLMIHYQKLFTILNHCVPFWPFLSI